MLSSRRPPLHTGYYRWSALVAPPYQQHTEPLHARHKDGSATRWVEEARLDALETGSFGGAYSTQAFQLDAFRLLHYTFVPQGKGLFTLLLQSSYPLFGLVPQESLNDRVLPLGTAQQIAQSLGACRCLVC